MAAFEEAPREFDQLAHDVADTLERLGKCERRGYHFAHEPTARYHRETFLPLVFQVERLARQVGELAQRLSGDTEP